MNALKACNTGQPSNFVGIRVGDPLNIEYYKGEAEEPDSQLDLTEAELVMVSKGKKVQEDIFS